MPASEPTRPDPDALLARLGAREGARREGRLKVFLGASPGVGKTYAMLETAHALHLQGKDVMIGVVETHGRAETAALIEGIPDLPKCPVEYRGATLYEFDLDAALAIGPDVIVVDELAHTNAPGSRHAKRWQDVEELLGAGVDVLTTVNIQHVESLNDVIAQITGITVRETVPDAILERADEVELVDVSPEVLHQRLREGKVYLPERAEQALERFFKEANLTALRELALRRTAELVDEKVRGWRSAEGASAVWPVSERLLVSIGPSEGALKLVRAARRLATTLRAEWFALHIETPAIAHDRGAQEAAQAALRLAESLGARVVTLSAVRAGDELLAWARANNITRILIGRPLGGGWRRLFRRNLLDYLVAGAGNIEVHVLPGEESGAPRSSIPGEPAALREWLEAGGLLLAGTLIGLILRDRLPVANVAGVFLLVVAVAATRVSRGPALTLCVAAIGVFDFAFVPPYYTFAVGDAAYIPTFGIMLAIGVIMTGLTARIREQAEAARDRERRTAALLELSRTLAATGDIPDLAAAAARQVQFIFHTGVVILLADDRGGLHPADPASLAAPLEQREYAVARWAYDRGQTAGLGTATLPESKLLWVPLRAAGRPVGVLGVRPSDRVRFRDPGLRLMLESFADQTASALERARLADQGRRSEVEIQTERLRNALLSSVSHDLRTPLGAIEGAATALNDHWGALTPEAREELLATVLEESRRMNRLVGNLLEMVRVESGQVQVQRELVPVEELIGGALERVDQLLKGREVVISLPPDLPLVPVDPVLLEQVLVNLLENGVRYTPAGSPFHLSAAQAGGNVVIEVADRGPGIPPDDVERIFAKFARLPGGEHAGGVGLGLAICRGIVEAHGGRIWVEAREGGGARFRLSIPLGPGRADAHEGA
ncbi:MAG TPA: sensor histidine kinase KdpD [Gemmatimonadales bacterium]|nr:sensor histidine kinase KdpD [Gemmatimonadales bacterium]